MSQNPRVVIGGGFFSPIMTRWGMGTLGRATDVRRMVSNARELARWSRVDARVREREDGREGGREGGRRRRYVG